MSAAALAERLRAVTTDDAPQTRGEAIARRMDRLGLTQVELSARCGVDRSTLARAMTNHPKVQPRTYARIESALARLEHELGHGGPDAVISTEQGLMEFEVTGDFGVRVVVKGPIENATELEASVTRLIRDIRRSPDDGPKE